VFKTNQKSTGTQYTTTAALLIVALIFSPAALIMYRPLGFLSVSLSVACSLFCLGLAWVNWKRYSDLSIPTMETQSPKSK
jgi:hypothetical protein